MYMFDENDCCIAGKVIILFCLMKTPVFTSSPCVQHEMLRGNDFVGRALFLMLAFVSDT